ncbi:helix-turn-helix domain-containing protein [Aminipila butyrica]|uniref:helix-turn-helix domain-containing protein n=1 Tax=Aminipila butyrica TaxID=433296 RepID=UPI001FE43CD2|nr:helix-turn-helix transcriptional regulator [Aminipila butyrica]
MKANKEKLKLAMANACMNTEDLAKVCEMPRPTLNNVIAGRGVRPKTLGRVAKVLNVPVEQILLKEV